MKMLSPIIALIVVVLIANSAFIVREGQSALLLQFGRIEGTESTSGSDYKPGLHFKLPLAQQVVRRARRIFNQDSNPQSRLPAEKKAGNGGF
jgi:membrane protease subunit HflC